MKKNLPDIDKLFRAALDGHEEIPSDKVWDALDRNLDRDKVIDFRKKYIHIKKIAIGLLVLLSGTGVYTFVTWKKGSGLSVDHLKNNNIENNPGTASLTKTLNRNTAPFSSAVDTGNINTPSLQTSVPLVENKIKQDTAVGLNESNDISATINNNAGVKKYGEIHKKDSHPQEKNITRSVIILTNPSTSAKLSAYKGLAKNGLNKANSKLYNAKGKLRSVTGNGGFEEQIEPGQVTGTTMQPTPAIPRIETIYPRLIRANTSRNIKRSLVRVSSVFPQSLLVTVRTAKKRVIKKSHFFTATIFFSPNLSSNFLKDDDDHNRSGGPHHDEDGDDIKKGEHHQSSSSFGLLIDYNFSRHWGVETGLSITNRKIGINPKTIYAANNGNGSIEYLYNCSSGYTFLSPKLAASPAPGDSLQAFEATNTLQYLVIPLAIKYNFSIKKIDLFTSIGASFNILTKGRLSTEIEAAPGMKEASISTKIIGSKSRYLGGSIGIGASYNLTNKIAFTFIPSYIFALTSSTKGALVKTYPNAVSLAAGIGYKF